MVKKLPKPSSKLSDYQGPYPNTSLENARRTLIDYVEDQDSTIWRRIRRKIGILEDGTRCGAFTGWGQCSTDFSNIDVTGTDTSASHIHSHESDSLSSGYKSDLKATEASSEVITLDSDEGNKESFHDGAEMDSSAAPVFGDGFYIDRGPGKHNADEEIVASSINLPVLTGKACVTKSQSKDSKLLTDNETKMNEFDNLQCEIEVTFKPTEALNDSHNRNFVETYMCDFCFTAAENKQLIKQHLEKETHFSASQYLVNIDEQKIFIKEKLSVMFKQAAFQKLVAKCLLCNNVFSNTFECAFHGQQHAGRTPERPGYLLAEVTEREEIHIDRHLRKCPVCNRKCSTNDVFFDHIKSEQHYPSTPLSDNEHVFYSCPLCEQNYSDYISLCSHQSEKHSSMCKSGTFPQVIVHLESVGYFFLADKEKVSEKTLKRKLKSEQRMLGEPCGKRQQMDVVSKNAECQVDTGIENKVRNGVKKGEHFDADIQKLAQCLFAADSEDDEEEGQKKNLTKIYRCDYCMALLHTNQEMTLHLRECRHYSASVVHANKNKSVMFLSGLMAVTAPECLYEALVVSCPSQFCSETFKTTLECAEHYRVRHGETEGQLYGISEIVAVKQFPFMQSYECQSCEMQCTSYGAYKSHLKKKKSHHQFEQIENAFAVFKCNDCHIVLPEFHKMVLHIISKLNKKRHGAPQCNASIHYVSWQVTNHTLLPFSPENEDELMQKKVKLLSNMKKSSKDGRSAYKIELRNLKRLRKKIKRKLTKSQSKMQNCVEHNG